MTTGRPTGPMDEDLGWLYEKLLLVAGLIESEPRTYLLEKKPEWDEGLDCDNVNGRARSADLMGPDEYIIEPGEDPSQDPGTPQPTRWLKFYHPVRSKPQIRIVVKESSGSPGKATKGHAERIAAYLRAWAERCAPREALTQSAPPTGVQSPIAAFASQFGEINFVGRQLQAAVRRLEEADAAGEVSQGVRRGRFRHMGQEACGNEDEVFREEQHLHLLVECVRWTRSVQRAVPAALDSLPAMQPWMDAVTEPAYERWTVRVAADLRELNGCPNRGQPDDRYPSELPWPDQAVSTALGEVLDRLERRWNELVSVERTGAGPIGVPKAALAGYSGLLDQTEVEALVRLEESEIWGVDELPETIDADMLRCLDRHGFVEARSVHMQDRRKFPGDKTPPTPSPSEWFSPIKQPSRAGDWDAVVSRHMGDSREHPSQVRLSDVGKAERAKILRTVGGALESEAGVIHGDDRGPDGVEADQHEAPAGAHIENELDGIKDTTFLSESDLAGRFKIPQSTFRRKLPKWRKSHMNNDWIPVKDRRPKDPHFLYRVLSIYPLIEEIRRSRRGSA